MITKLRDMLEKEREQFRLNERELVEKTQEVDSMRSQMDRVSQICSELRRKNKIVQTQGRLLVEEKADLQAHLHDVDQKLKRLREKLGLDDKEGSPDLDGKIVIDPKSED
ncbi:PREDICTED: RILP-like protein homolog, partial [Priapulus caudatus]|uniref:RILP-like protein homolog n=1 Tax=Priapulus caudatus TaxID=37621 RepID=A0ABM1EPD9_PRICU